MTETEKLRKINKLREKALNAVDEFYDALNFNQFGTVDDREHVKEAFWHLSQVNGGVWFEDAKEVENA